MGITIQIQFREVSGNETNQKNKYIVTKSLEFIGILVHIRAGLWYGDAAFLSLKYCSVLLKFFSDGMNINVFPVRSDIM